ncbi:MAG: T9SS type A sorting domain-containing protein [Chitinophagaceae bacterium]|nr:T9SS type A sorting domain-containing protein [Chitinophagaceae bacterium]
MRKFTIPLKGFRTLTAALLLMILSNAAAAQFITYPVPSQAITRGLDSTLLTVQISFPACTNVSVTVNLGATNAPGLIEYIPGSVTKISGTGTITESNISNLSSPVFSIGNTTLGQTLRFTIRRRAFCGSAASTKDNIVVTGTGGGCNFSETNTNINTYTLLAPAFTITPPASLVNANVGDTYNRSIGVVNGGNGCADTVGFWIKYPAASMQLNGLSFAGNPITPIFTNGDSSYFELSGLLLGADNKLCNGETVTLVENVTILKCKIVTTYGAAGFDFANTRCQVTAAVSGMSMSNALPSLGVALAPASALSSCFVSAPRVMTYTITNNGAGPATNIVVNTGSQFNNLPRGDSYGYIDTASLQLTLPGGSAFHPDNSYYTGFTATFSSAGVNNLICNEGKVAHLQLTLPASVILGAGESITLVYNVVYCSTTNSCTDVYTSNSQGTQVLYKNACGNTNYSTGNYAGSTSLAFNVPSITSFEFPAQVRAGDCYDVTLSTNTNITSNLSTRSYIEYTLTLPPGVTFSAANLIGIVSPPQAGYPRVIGNKVITRYNTNTGGNQVKFIFCTPSTLCTTENLSATVTVSPDSSCEISNPANINSVSRCSSSPISFVCTGPCNTGGTVPVYWKYNRKNYGDPDNNFNKLSDGPGAVDPNIVYKDRYRPGDTLHSEYRGYLVAQTTPASITSWNHVNSNWSFSKHIWVPAGTATVTIKRGAVTTVVPAVPVAVVTYGKEYNADFSQAPVALTSLAPFLPDDSVIVEADFILKDSLLSSPTPASVVHMTAVDDGTRGKAFADAPDIVLLRNSVHASVVANPAAIDQFTCFVPLYNANTLHLFHFSLLYGSNLTGCNAAKHEIRGFTRKLGGYTANYFPGEYRPEFIPDSLILAFPVGMTVIPGSQSVSGILVNTPPTSTAVSNASILPYVTISGSSATGTTVIFDTRAALAANPGWKIQSEGNTYIFGMDARGGCATANAFSIAGRQTGHIYQWPSQVSEARYDDSARTQVSSSYSNLNKPNVNLSSPDATVAPASDTANWSILLQNSSGQQAPFNYIRITNNASFENIIVKIGNTVYTPNTDGLYELGNISSGATTTVSITANTNSCSADSILVESGWDCAAYPTGIELSSYSCWKTLWLTADPLLSQIQLSVERQPVSPDIALCTNDTMIFKINSALANYADNAEFRVTVPEGMVIASGEIEYPDGSGNWETITPDNDNGVLVYKIESHSGVDSVGLPGTISNPGTANRAANLRLSYSANCDFVSGSKVSVQQRADRPCGLQISTDLGFNGVVRANPVNITGATGPGIVGFDLNLAPATINCGTTTISGNITPSGESTTASDTIVVVFPPGVEYAGNFVSADGMTVAAGFPAAGVGGSQVLKLKVPVGISSGNPVNYSFDIQASFVDFGCGKLVISSQMERTSAILSCNGTPCPNGSRYVVGSTENLITIEKPDLSITGFEYVSGSFAEGGTATVAITVANSAMLAAAASSYNVEFFCGSNTTAFASALFTPAIPAQSNATDNLTISIPASPVCNNGESVTAAIRPLTALNQQQCLCQGTTRGILKALPVVLDNFSARQDNCKIMLNWHSATELNFKRYDVEVSTNGRTFSTAGTVTGRGDNSNYTFSHQPAPGRVYYRLKMLDNNGVAKYSSIIAMNLSCTGKNLLLYPNPASSVLNVNLSGFAGTINGKLYNSTGQLIASRQLLNGTNSIAVDRLPAGTYALVVNEQDGTPQVYKVQITH